MTIFFVTKNELVMFLFLTVMLCFFRFYPIENSSSFSRDILQNRSLQRSFFFSRFSITINALRAFTILFSFHIRKELSLYLYSKKTKTKEKKRNVYVTVQRYRQRLEWIRADLTFTVINDHGEATRNPIRLPDWNHLDHSTALA